MRWKRQYRYFILPLQNNRWSPLLCFLLNEWPAARRTSPPVTSTKQPPHHLDYSFLPIFFCWLFLPIIICHVIHSYLFRYNAAIGCLTIIVIIVNILATAFGGPDNDCTPTVSALEWKVSGSHTWEERKDSAWQWLHPRKAEMVFSQKLMFISPNICHSETSHFWKSAITIDLKTLPEESFRTLCLNYETKAINLMS